MFCQVARILLVWYCVACDAICRAWTTGRPRDAPQEDHPEERSHEAVRLRELPRGRKDPPADGEGAGLRGRARRRARRPRGVGRVGGRGDERREGGRAAVGPGRDTPHAARRQEGREQAQRRMRGGAGRVLGPGDRGRAAQPLSRAGLLLRPERRDEAAGRRAHPGARVQEGRLGEEGPPLLPLRPVARRRLPGHGRAGGGQGLGGRGHEQGDRLLRRPRRLQRLLRRHQLLLRVRPPRGPTGPGGAGSRRSAGRCR